MPHTSRTGRRAWGEEGEEERRTWGWLEEMARRSCGEQAPPAAGASERSRKSRRTWGGSVRLLRGAGPGHLADAGPQPQLQLALVAAGEGGGVVRRLEVRHLRCRCMCSRVLQGPIFLETT